MAGGKASGVEVVHTTTQPRVKVWVEGNLQPKQYNQIQVGASLEIDVPDNTTASKVVSSSFDAILKDLEKQVKVAFAKMGFKWG